MIWRTGIGVHLCLCTAVCSGLLVLIGTPQMAMAVEGESPSAGAPQAERKLVRELANEYKLSRTEDARRAEIIAQVVDFHDDTAMAFYKQIRRTLEAQYMAYGKAFMAEVSWQAQTPSAVLEQSADLQQLRQALIASGDLELPLRRRLADLLAAEAEENRNANVIPAPGVQPYATYLKAQEELAIENWVKAATANGPDAEELAVVEAMNKMRESMGLKPLEINMRLTLAARDHSSDMQKLGFFSHTSPVEGKSTFSDRAKRFGYPRPAGENIYTGSTRGADAFTGWKNSPPHYKNMINPDFTTVGVGRSGKLWTQLFGR